MGIEQEILRGCGAVISNEGEREVELRAKKVVGKPRYELIDREQLCWRRVDVERLIGEEHPGRAIWEFVGKLDFEPVPRTGTSGRGQSRTAGVGAAVTD